MPRKTWHSVANGSQRFHIYTSCRCVDLMLCRSTMVHWSLAFRNTLRQKSEGQWKVLLVLCIENAAHAKPNTGLSKNNERGYLIKITTGGPQV